ncbi:hypothetical protein EYV94_26960 [Puteibacter caeruleilacunae]|nr:hypothetical protein EYV94_26960 [Puteibacter caeruleilacunae]
MKKFFTTAIYLLAISGTIIAQDGETLADLHNLYEANSTVNKVEKTVSAKFEFITLSDSDQLEKITIEESGTHSLGNLIAKKQFLFEKTYTYSTPIAPGNPGMRTVIRKPLIYNAVQKLERYYKKQMKKQKLTSNDAQTSYKKVLDVAQAAFSEDTEKFEAHIRTIKDIEDLHSLFGDVKISLY